MALGTRAPQTQPKHDLLHVGTLRSVPALNEGHIGRVVLPSILSLGVSSSAVHIMHVQCVSVSLTEQNICVCELAPGTDTASKHAAPTIDVAVGMQRKREADKGSDRRRRDVVASAIRTLETFVHLAKVLAQVSTQIAECVRFCKADYAPCGQTANQVMYPCTVLSVQQASHPLKQVACRTSLSCKLCGRSSGSSQSPASRPRSGGSG